MKDVFFRILGRLIIWVSGWRVDQSLKQDYRRCVVVAAPHTSSLDFVFARAAFEVMKVPVRFTIKKEWTTGPLGWLLKALGAIGIDRRPKDKQSQPISYVDAMAKLFSENKDLAVLITPEGTRSRQTTWKTGFYHVAKTAGVPIALGYLDYQEKVAGIGKILWPGEDMETDMKTIMAFYQDKHPKFPEKFAIDDRYQPDNL
ncbi:MAG TPA: 1-acyl-sn-glycerol-3-phosphate acyltransferase [Catalimonadaceae bacterium]|nr:1-acyl-sn-glycerol-3-phosphate acyltransferase [Catalimonadaceae bacterium]